MVFYLCRNVKWVNERCKAYRFLKVSNGKELHTKGESGIFIPAVSDGSELYRAQLFL